MIGKMYEIVLDRLLVNIPRRSNRCPVVIIDDTTQHFSLLNSTTPDRLSTWQRYPLPYSLMRTSCIVITFNILMQYATKMCFVQDQDVIKTLFSNRPYPSFRKRVGIRCLMWGVNDM